MSETSTAQATVRSVDRALDLLELLENSTTPLRLVELSRGAELQNATTLRILGSLQRRGLVSTENGQYRLGPAALGMANGYLTNDPLSGHARPVLQQLADTTKLTASLYVRIGLARILAVRVDGENPLRYQLPLGRRLPLAVGAGKSILASFPDEELDSALAAIGDTTTAAGRHVTSAELRDELAAIKQSGFHISVNEREVGVAAASVPIFDASGRIVAALSASGPTETTTPAQLERWIPELRRAARAAER